MMNQQQKVTTLIQNPNTSRIRNNVTLDKQDMKILTIMQEDASLSIADIAKKAGISQTPCWRRIKRLKEAGVITKLKAIVDYQKMGFSIEVMTHIKLDNTNPEADEIFLTHLNTWPEVVHCVRLAETGYYMLHVIVVDMKTYDDFLCQKIAKCPVVISTQSEFVSSTIISQRALMLDEN